MSKTMRFSRVVAGVLSGSLVLLLLGIASHASAQEPKQGKSPLADIRWQVGPVQVDIGAMAQMQVPEGYIYAGQADTRKLMEITGNPPSNKELGFLSPKDLSWFIVFEFDEIGYIENAEKEDLDADDILDSIKKGNEQANEVRKQRGWSQLIIEGWQKAPFYDPGSKNLQWAIKGNSEGKPVVNYNTRVLGRKGVMAVNLVIDPEKLDATIPVVKTLLGGYGFKSGETYAEYKPGDKIAKYGLAALVTGVGVAAAAKSGLLAKIFAKAGKLLILVGVVLLAFLKKIFNFFTGRKPEATAVQTVAQAPEADEEYTDEEDEDEGGRGNRPPA